MAVTNEFLAQVLATKKKHLGDPVLGFDPSDTPKKVCVLRDSGLRTEWCDANTMCEEDFTSSNRVTP